MFCVPEMKKNKHNRRECERDGQANVINIEERQSGIDKWVPWRKLLEQISESILYNSAEVTKQENQTF